jgi:ubiquinone/menaquinone biosynthesis C-methylase UbiE
MSTQALTRSEVETAIERRDAEVYAGFLRPHLRPDMVVLDCGCGKATIASGLAEAVPNGRVVGVDLDQGSLTIAGRYAVSMERRSLVFVAADGLRLPFRGAAFDSVLCHSVLETLGDPARVVAELGRVGKPGGLVGAASVDYGGIILGSEHAATPSRFYEIRRQLWRASGIAEPNMGRRLRGLELSVPRSRKSDSLAAGKRRRVTETT